jgi:hypothetical protein
MGYRIEYLSPIRIRPNPFSMVDLTKVRDEHVRMSLELQQAFGLRREEAIKFIPSYADQGGHLVLKPSWTKGGKARVIPIRTEERREVLDRAHRLEGTGCRWAIL